MDEGQYLKSLCKKYKYLEKEVVKQYKKYFENKIKPRYSDPAVLKYYEHGFFYVFFDFNKPAKFASDYELKIQIFKKTVDEIKNNYEKEEAVVVDGTCNLYSILYEDYDC